MAGLEEFKGRVTSNKRRWLFFLLPSAFCIVQNRLASPQTLPILRLRKRQVERRQVFHAVFQLSRMFADDGRNLREDSALFIAPASCNSRISLFASTTGSGSTKSVARSTIDRGRRL